MTDSAHDDTAGIPNLRHIRLFGAVARLQSLSMAAEAVHVSQPAASQAIARLERLFGARLLERRGTGVLLTPIGHIVEKRARRTLDLLQAADFRLLRFARVVADAEPLVHNATTTHLRALAAVAEAGSFSAAGRLLGKAEPSIQRAAREIERIVGVPLFDGNPRALRLTAAGGMLALHAGLALKELRNALDEVREHQGRFDGRVVIGTLPLVRTSIVPAAVVAVKGRRAAAHFEIQEGSYESQLNSLLAGQIDILVGGLRQLKLPYQLTQETLFEDGLAIIARANHPLAALLAIAPRDLAAYPWVLPRSGTPSRSIFEEIARDFPRERLNSGFVETSSLVALRGILTQSDHLAILSPRQVSYELRSNLLCVLPVELSDSIRPIGLMVRRDWQPTALQAETLNALRAAALKPWLSQP